MKKILLFFICCFVFQQVSFAQYELLNTFKSTRIINTHSVETLPKRILDMRIGHRFGDLAGSAGGWATFYGLENASDVLIGFDYGVTNTLTVGINRTKGAGSLRQLINGQAKFRFLSQSDNMPISVALVGNATISTQTANESPNTITTFDEFGHRMVYVGQLLIARKFSEALSLQLTPSFVHRNVVEFNDQNDLITLELVKKLNFIILPK